MNHFPADNIPFDVSKRYQFSKAYNLVRTSFHSFLGHLHQLKVLDYVGRQTRNRRCAIHEKFLLFQKNRED